MANETLNGFLSAVGGMSGTISGQENLSGSMSVPDTHYEPYDLPPATTASLGGIIVGDDLIITEEGRLSVDKATSVDGDNTRPITAAAVYTEIGNINALLATI